jgi:glycosyltransferase involved in cell wall biosynthesis
MLRTVPAGLGRPVGSGCMRVLFLARSGDRRGDGQVLLTFLRWLHDDEIEPVVVVGSDGPLVAEFERVAETHVLFPAPPAASASSRARRAYNLVIGARSELDRRRFRKRLGTFDLVYVNGLGGAAPLVGRLGITDEAPILTHLHEQAYILGKFERESGEARRFIRRTDHFIAVSATGAAALHDEYDVPESSISIVFPFIDVDELAAQQSPVHLRELAGLPDNAFIVGGAGSVEWRKAPDVFVQVAREVGRRHRDSEVAFVWLGHAGIGQSDQLRHDIAAMGLGNVHFIGEQANGPALFREFDVLCLPSREDPFACVLLESAAGGVPSVRFRDAGGRPVFGSNGGAIVVDYLDVAAMGQALADLIDDRPRLHALGAQAKECVQELDVRNAGPQIAELIHATARSRVRSA